MIGTRNGVRSAQQRERAKEIRREAYQKAKAARAKDPRYQAMKEAAKVQRREAYKAAKERHKAARAEEKTRADIEREVQQTEKRAVFDRALMELVRRGAKSA
ncbi:MAG TPA: hypothetical protein VHU80_09410 [Polyangiaceae bacterium]|jgi:hypothetical protein|nr:hypothetical protein [Polyangiaceae bacterium]